MGTVVQRFYPHHTDWDGTDPASGDVRKLLTSLPAFADTSICDFGTSGAKTITVDPETTRSTTGVSSAFGFAINIAGADGMGGTSTAKRLIPAGVWGFSGGLKAGPVASLASCTLDFYVYRVAASPSTTRTLLFQAQVSVGLISTTGTGYAFSTASQSQIILEAGETIQVTPILTCTGQIGGLTIAYMLGDLVTTADCFIDLPTPGLRTLYLPSLADTAPATDAATRLASFPRAVTNGTAGAVDAATRATTTARAAADTAGASDAATRVASFPRAVANGTAAASDTATRAATVARALPDTAAASDAATRATTAARTVANGTAGAADAATRATTTARTITDTAPATDAATRVASFPRAVANGTAGAVDTVTRSTTAARAAADTAGAADTVGRILNYVRATADNIGPDPVDPVANPARQIAGVVRNQSGTPVAGATVKLFRQADDRAVRTTTSAGDGAYLFTRDVFDTAAYYVLSYLPGSPSTQGVTERDLVPS